MQCHNMISLLNSSRFDKMRFIYLMFVTLAVASLAFADDDTTTVGDESEVFGDEQIMADDAEMMNDEEVDDPARIAKKHGKKRWVDYSF